jgi:hypothetical protein
MFEDQRGTMSGPICHPPNPPDHPEYAVYDYEIYPETYLESNFFVLINTCNSAYIADTIGQNWAVFMKDMETTSSLTKKSTLKSKQ